MHSRQRGDIVFILLAVTAVAFLGFCLYTLSHAMKSIVDAMQDRVPAANAEGPLDKQIAATALLYGLTVVTRNVPHYEADRRYRPEPLHLNDGDREAIRTPRRRRTLAGLSDESGRQEIYVRPFPNVDNGKWLVSTGGGSRFVARFFERRCRTTRIGSTPGLGIIH